MPRNGTAKQIWLSILYHEYKLDPDKFIDKNEISLIVNRINPRFGTDQQVRHLKRDGWNLITAKRGWHKLNPYIPSLVFTHEQIKRTKLLSAKTFYDVKKSHNNLCITCGEQEGKKHREYREIVTLQETNKDPAKPNAIENIIPQCQFCNQSYKSNFTCDEKGRVRAIASIEPVKRASKQVKKDVLRFLKKLFE